MKGICRLCELPLPVDSYRQRVHVECKAAASLKWEQKRKGVVLRPEDPICPICHLQFRNIDVQHVRTHGYSDLETFRKEFGLKRMCRKGLHEIAASLQKCPTCTEANKRTKQYGNDPSLDFVICPVCHLKFKVLRTSHAKKHGFNDLRSFKEHFGLKSCVAESERDRVAAFMRQPRPDRKGKPSPQIGYTRNAESRARMSKAAVARCLRNPGPLFSRIRGEWIWSEKAESLVYARSSYEKRLLKALDLRPDVKRVEVEPFAIPYEYEGVTLNYIPDLIVTYIWGERELWEVKPVKFIDDPKNQAKALALYDYANAHSMNMTIITLENIKAMEEHFSEWEKIALQDSMHQNHDAVCDEDADSLVASCFAGGLLPPSAA